MMLHVGFVGVLSVLFLASLDINPLYYRFKCL